MLHAVKEFRVGGPQIFAGLMLLIFLAQCLATARTRPLSELEYQFIAAGMPEGAVKHVTFSPFTNLVAALPVRMVHRVRQIAPARVSEALAVPRPWLLRSPFIIFGIWLGGALWWVARRLFDNEGGYVALGLYCTSPAIIQISSNIGPEIILAWSSLGMIYTAIGVAHTLYAPPKKWAPRIMILGLSIGFALATAWWSVTLVILAAGYMLYLAPGCRRKVMLVLSGASVIACVTWALVAWLAGSAGLSAKAVFAQKPAFDALANLAFVFSANTDGYVLVALFIVALTAYGSWDRARYFGNTAPLLTAFVVVLLFAFVPAIHIWNATLGLSFVFIFIGGVAADLLEVRFRGRVAALFGACLVLRSVLTLIALSVWAHNSM